MWMDFLEHILCMFRRISTQEKDSYLFYMEPTAWTNKSDEVGVAIIYPDGYLTNWTSASYSGTDPTNTSSW